MTDLTSIMQCHEADFRVVVPRCALVLPAFTNGITVFTTCTGMITLSSFRIVPRAAMPTNAVSGKCSSHHYDTVKQLPRWVFSWTTLSFDRDSHCHQCSQFHCCNYTIFAETPLIVTVLSSSWRKAHRNDRSVNTKLPTITAHVVYHPPRYCNRSSQQY